MRKEGIDLLEAIMQKYFPLYRKKIDLILSFVNAVVINMLIQGNYIVGGIIV